MGVLELGRDNPSGMLWSIKDSFLEYVASQPDGEVTQAPEKFLGNPAFYFSALSRSGGIEAGFSFSGRALFKAHGGALDVTISNPSISLLDDKASLLIDDDRSETGQLELARLSAAEAGTVNGKAATIWASVILTLDGTDVFGGFYNPRTRLAPIAVIHGDQSSATARG